VNVTVEVNALANDLAQAMDPATTSPANTPTNAVRWNSANGFWEKFSGTTWNALASVYNIVAAQANKLKSAVTIAITGDISGSTSFDGSQSVTIAATLPNVNGNPGTVGGSTVIPVITANAKGHVTAMSSASISFPSAPVTSVFGRTGAVSLGSGDVTGALGYTPPQPGGAGASGTWGINISGSASSASSATNASYATTAGSANSVAWGNVSSRPTDLGSFSNGPGYMNAVVLGNCYGDNSNPSSGTFATNVLPYRSGSTLVIVRNTNCNCNCSC
jgi:hypothetical protein